MAEDKQRDANEPEERAETEAEEPTATPDEPVSEPAAEAEEPAATPDEPVSEPAAEAEARADEPAEAPAAEAEAPAHEPAEAPAAEAEAPAEEPAEAPAAEGEEAAVKGDAGATDDIEELEERPRVKPEIPGADLEVDIVREGDERFRGESRWDEELEEEPSGEAVAEAEEPEPQPIADAAIDLAAGARYAATGKRKTAVARVILKPGNGAYAINGRTLEQHFPRNTLQRNIRQPLEAVGYESRMDVVATMHGGGVSAQAGALRHGISRALIEADPNLRSELKRRGFLTRDARVKERKKAGLKKARKRPQFSKR
jgi:small subunit ribosomal protein S9